MRVSKYHIFLAQHRLGFAHLAVISMVVSVFLLCLPSVCSVASYIRYLTHWLLCRTLFILITFLNMAFCENPGLHTCFGFNFNRGLNNTDGFASNRLFHKELFYTKTVAYTNTMFYTKTMFLLGLCKGCLRLAG